MSWRSPATRSPTATIIRPRPVHDLDLLELLTAIQTMQTGRDLAGVDLKGAPQFLVGATVKVTADAGALKQELADLDQKIAAGARFFTTQPVFDVEVLEKFRQQVGKRQAAIIPTVMLLKSVGMARYINAHMEMKIPEAFVTRIQKSSDRVRECVQIAAEFVAAVKKTGIPGSARLHHRVGGQTAVDPGARPVYSGIRIFL